MLFRSPACDDSKRSRNDECVVDIIITIRSCGTQSTLCTVVCTVMKVVGSDESGILHTRRKQETSAQVYRRTVHLHKLSPPPKRRLRSSAQSCSAQGSKHHYFLLVTIFVIACRMTMPAFSVSFFVNPDVTQTLSAGVGCHACSLGDRKSVV